MNLTYIDFIAFGAFLAVVVGVSLYAGPEMGQSPASLLFFILLSHTRLIRSG